MLISQTPERATKRRASRQGLHRDGAQALLLGQGQELAALELDNVIWEHDGFDFVAELVDEAAQNVQAVGGYADVADFSGLSGLVQGLPGSAGGKDLVDVLFARVVELIQVDKVCAQVGQAGFNVLLHRGGVPRHGFGGQDKVFPPALQGLAQVFLRDGIAAGGVDVVDAVFLQLVHDGFRVGRVGALDGDASKRYKGGLEAGLS